MVWHRETKPHLFFTTTHNLRQNKINNRTKDKT